MANPAHALHGAMSFSHILGATRASLCMRSVNDLRPYSRPALPAESVSASGSMDFSRPVLWRGHISAFLWF
jgi:hypothetical protein